MELEISPELRQLTLAREAHMINVREATTRDMIIREKGDKATHDTTIHR